MDGVPNKYDVLANWKKFNWGIPDDEPLSSLPCEAEEKAEIAKRVFYRNIGIGVAVAFLGVRVALATRKFTHLKRSTSPPLKWSSLAVGSLGALFALSQQWARHSKESQIREQIRAKIQEQIDKARPTMRRLHPDIYKKLVERWGTMELIQDRTWILKTAKAVEIYLDSGPNAQTRFETCGQNPEVIGSLPEDILKDFSEREAKSQELIKAAKNGQKEQVEAELKRDDIWINAPESSKGRKTALHWAASRGDTEIMKLLLEQEGIDVNVINKWGNTALHEATWNGRTEIVKLLLEQEGIDVNAVNGSGDTALYKAAGGGHKEVVKLLLEQEGIDVNAKCDINRTALDAAVYTYKCGYLKSSSTQACLDIVNMLLKREDIDVNATYKQGEEILRWAVDGQTEILTKMLIKHSDINAAIIDGGPALVWAAKENCETVVKALLLEQENIDVNAMDKGGWTALHRATLKGRIEIVRMLLSHPKIDVSAVDKNSGNTAFHQAVDGGDAEIVQLLLEKGVDVNAFYGNNSYWKGYNALHVAADRGHIEVVNILLGCDDINVNATCKYCAHSSYKHTALDLAIRLRRTEIARQLLNHKNIDINATYKKGEEILRWAAREGCSEMVKKLVDHNGIDINASDKDGQTALHQAVWEGHVEIVKVLLDSDDIQVNATTTWSKTALHWAASLGDTEIVQLLLSKEGINIDAVDQDGKTAVQLAESAKKAEVVKLLVSL